MEEKPTIPSTQETPPSAAPSPAEGVPPPPPSIPSSIILIMLVGFVGLLGFAGVLIWRSLQVQPTSSSTSHVQEISRSSHETQSIAAEPEALAVDPEEVLREAAAMKGARYLEGALGIAETQYLIKGWYPKLLQSKSSIEVAFFDHELSTEEITLFTSLPSFKNAELPGMLFLATFEFNPFGSDCSIISLKRYFLTFAAPLLGGDAQIETSKDATISEVKDIKKISCTRKKDEMFELAMEGAPRPGITVKLNARGELRG